MATTQKKAAAIDSKTLAGLKSRLAKNTLTKQDQGYLTGLLNKAALDAKGKSIAGRPIVARLPHGMDIIK